MLKNEGVAIEPCMRPGRLSVVGVLQQLGQYVPRTLDLIEELHPWPCDIRLLLERAPGPLRLPEDTVNKRGRNK